MKRYLKPAVIATVFLTILLFNIASPVRADAVVGDGTPESCTEMALRIGIDQGGIIVFNCGGNKEIDITSSIQLSGVLSIDGGNAITINAGRYDKIFIVESGTQATLKNLVLLDGYSLTGGAIENKGSLIIENVHFKGNRGVSNGGALFNSGSLSIKDSTFEGNRALNGSGGAIYKHIHR